MIFSSIFWKNRVCFVSFYVKICDKFTLTQKKDHGRSTTIQQLERSYHTFTPWTKATKATLTIFSDVGKLWQRYKIYNRFVFVDRWCRRFVQHATKYYIADVDAETSSSSDCVFHDLVRISRQTIRIYNYNLSIGYIF